MATLTFDRYGKTRVRLLQVLRQGDRHEVTELSAQILFEGDLAASYATGDNSAVLPTDTMKNTVYALARQHPIFCLEHFARDLGQHFLSRLPQLHQVAVELSEVPWHRMHNHDSAFSHGGNERRIASCTVTRRGPEIISGLRNLQILKTANSGFSGFLKDEFTTLPETADRLFGTVLDADWRYAPGDHDFNALASAIRARLLEVFAKHASLSVQHTLFAMAQDVIYQFPMLKEVHLIMPNKHCLLADLSRFGLDNPNQIFIPTDEPSGFIEAKLVR
jgi:urate oxidase